MTNKRFPNLHSQIRTTFWRGGTSRGLIFNASRLAPFEQATRDAILCSAMGSPDPDGRQIDGLGGGTSSTSKVAILNSPGRSLVSQANVAGNPFPGVKWSEDYAASQCPKTGWDVVYRFGQVPINGGTTVDWGSTCGNLIAAVAKHTVWSEILDQSRINAKAEEMGVDLELPGAAFAVPIRILLAHNGAKILARVPITKYEDKWLADDIGNAAIAGVPGTNSSIVIELPLQSEELLPTGNVRDKVSLQGNEVEVSIVDAGLPVIFVHAASLGVDFAQLTSHPMSLDADIGLMLRVEALREAASGLSPKLSSLYFPGSAAPKVCLIHPRQEYQTTSGSTIGHDDADILIRAVSVGQFHRTIPATTLSALGVAASMNKSLVADVVQQGGPSAQKPTPAWAQASVAGSSATVNSVAAAHPAGVSSTCVRTQQGSSLPDAIVMERTARILMDGATLFPAHLYSMYPPFRELMDEQKPQEPAVDLPMRGARLGKTEWRGRKLGNDDLKPASSVPLELRSSKVASKSTPGQSRTFMTSAMDRAQATLGASEEQVKPLHLYRHLLRSVSRHASIPRHFRSSLQRLIKEGFKASDDATTLVERVEATLFLLLSASQPGSATSLETKLAAIHRDPLQPPHIASHTLARRVLENLASLTYHHLSPNTLMLSKRNPRMGGGSNTSAARQARSRLSLGLADRTKATLALLDEADGFANGNNNPEVVLGSQILLRPLTVAEKPLRGPAITHDRPMAWDGQRPQKHINAGEGTNQLPGRGPTIPPMAVLQDTLLKAQQSVERVIEERTAFQEGTEIIAAPVPESKPSSSFRDKKKSKKKDRPLTREERKADIDRRFIEARGMVRSARTALRKAKLREDIQDVGKKSLLEVVKGLEVGWREEGSGSSGPLVGSVRWEKWYRGEYLAP